MQDEQLPDFNFPKEEVWMGLEARLRTTMHGKSEEFIDTVVSRIRSCFDRVWFECTFVPVSFPPPPLQLKPDCQPVPGFEEWIRDYWEHSQLHIIEHYRKLFREEFRNVFTKMLNHMIEVETKIVGLEKALGNFLP